MTASWFSTYRPSLRRWTRGFAIAWLFSALMVAPVAVACGFRRDVGRHSDHCPATHSELKPATIPINHRPV